SSTGKFVSTPIQIDRIFENMRDWHEGKWGQDERHHVVLYAHGGLAGEADGLATAQKHLNWWLNNRIYPVTFAWQSGPTGTLLDHGADRLRGRLPAGGLGVDLVEQFDRLTEQLARQLVAWMWAEMKENARRASHRLRGRVGWPPASAAARRRIGGLPGASL